MYVEAGYKVMRRGDKVGLITDQSSEPGGLGGTTFTHSELSWDHSCKFKEFKYSPFIIMT